MMSPEERYVTDPVFQRFVDMFEVVLHQGEVTPSEVRQAAMLACIKFEHKKPHYIVVTKEEARRLGLTV